MNRFPMPKEEPLSPEFVGEFPIDEASISLQDWPVKFFADPTTGPIRCSLKVAYYIPEGDREAQTDKWYWRGADNEFWELISHPESECALDDLLYKTPSLLRAFELWVADNSKPKEPKYQSVFDAELARSVR